MKTILPSLGDFEGIFVGSRGRAGGLALLWIKSTDSLSVTLLSCTTNHIDVAVRWKVSEPEWQFTGVYGFPETQNKLKTCELLLDLKDRSNLPWLIGGDINEIIFNFEKSSGPPKSQMVLDAFRETLEECGLFDLGYNGHPFTWWNKQKGPKAIEERLDRYCANGE